MAGTLATIAKLLLLGLVALPFMVMLTVALTDSGLMLLLGGASQAELTLTHLGHVLRDGAYLTYFINSSIVAGGTLLGQLLVSVPAGFALARLRLPGRGLFFAAVLAALVVPHEVLALPLFVGMSSLGLMDTLVALILPSIASPFAIFLFRQVFLTLPQDLLDAAAIDGIGSFGMLTRIGLPVAASAIAAFAVISLSAHWNDLLWPLIVSQTEASRTVPLGLINYRNEESGDDYGPLMAACLLMVAPLLIMFLALQRHFVRGLTFLGLK